MIRKLTQLFIIVTILVSLSVVFSETEVSAQDDIIFVGSKAFTEAEILSWIVYLVLEDEGLRVIDQMQTAPSTGEVRQTLLDGDIDVYVEYTATGVLFLADENDGIEVDQAFDCATAFSTVSIFDSTNNDLTWLQPAPANNQYALAVTGDFASENEIETLEDLALYINTGNDLVVAGNTEFFDRPDAYSSFEATYEWTADSDQIYDMGADAQAPETLTALETGDNDTNVAMAYTTDGELLVGDYVVLEDTMSAQPCYSPTPVFRGDVIRNNPQVVTRLTRIFQELDNRTLQNLNVSVTRFGDTPREAATNFLVGEGEIGEGSVCDVTRDESETERAILRAQPSADADRRSTMPPGTSLAVDGQFADDDGTIWYRLVLGPWVSSEDVEIETDCVLAEITP